MAEERVERRLVAIFAADMVGYSRLMEADETGMVFVLAASTLAHLGRTDEARVLLTEAKMRKPGFSIDTVRSAAGQFGPRSGVARIIDGLRMAGVQEE